VSKPDRALEPVKSTEQIIDQIYSTAFRLTGKKQSAEVLTVEAINTAMNKKGILTFRAALKGLCYSFLNSPVPQRNIQFKNCGFNSGAVNSEQVQEALLYLEPVERLVLILREIWRFSYWEIADLTGLNKDKVAKVLAQGRLSLRNFFCTGSSD